MSQQSKVVRALMKQGDAFCRTNFENNIKEYFRYLEYRVSGGSSVHGDFLWHMTNVFGEAAPLYLDFVDARTSACGVRCPVAYQNGSISPTYCTFGPQLLVPSVKKYDPKTWCEPNAERIEKWEEQYQDFRELFWDRLESAADRADIRVDNVRTVIGLDVGCLTREGWATNRVAFDIAQLFNDRAASGHNTSLILEDPTLCEAGITQLTNHFQTSVQGPALVDVSFSGPDIAIDPDDPTRSDDIINTVNDGLDEFLSRFGLSHLDENAFVVAVAPGYNVRQIFADFAKDMPNGGPVGILCEKIVDDGVNDTDTTYPDPSSINLLAYKSGASRLKWVKRQS